MPPKRDADVAECDRRAVTLSSFRKSDALNSNSSQPNSFASACASAVLPVPAEPVTRRGGCLFPSCHPCAHAFAAAMADGLPMREESDGLAPIDAMTVVGMNWF